MPQFPPDGDTLAQIIIKRPIDDTCPLAYQIIYYFSFFIVNRIHT